jgi:hypothetical protein
MTDILTRLNDLIELEARPHHERPAEVHRAREHALIALVQEAAREIERLRKLAAESRDMLAS